MAMSLDILREGLIEEKSGQLGVANDIRAMLRKFTERTAQLSYSLAPVLMGHRGLKQALRRLADDTDRIDGVTCRFFDKCNASIEDGDTATHLFRIAQEAVNNALRHSKASVIDIICSDHEGNLYLTIEDNGDGLPDDYKRGYGIKIMQYRSRILGASLEVGEKSPHGTRVLCVCPLRDS